jgi:membrane protease YdiL (CAAX protease family)
MNAHADRWRAQVIRPIAAIALDRRLARAVVATLVIGGYMALGFAFRLGAEAYLLLGIPITIAFQVLVVRRPLRALWLRQAPPMTFTPRSIGAIVVLAIAPAIVAASGVRDGDPALFGWGLAAMIGALGAVYALRAMDRDGVRSTIRTTLITAAVLVGIMVAYRLATGGFNGNLAAAVTTAVISLLTYLPVVFVMEEVLFRGLIDTYLHGSTPGPDRPSALYGSALWGIWHLPVAFLALGILTIPYLVAAHIVLGYFLVTSRRRTGNLAAPGVAHAVIDALRNAVAVY